MYFRAKKQQQKTITFGGVIVTLCIHACFAPAFLHLAIELETNQHHLFIVY